MPITHQASFWKCQKIFLPVSLVRILFMSPHPLLQRLSFSCHFDFILWEQLRSGFSFLLFRKTLLVPISSCGIMICASIKKSTIMFFCSSLWSLTCSSATAQRGHLKPSQLRSRIASAFLFSLAVKRLLPSVSSIFWYFTPICIDRSSRDSFILSPTVPLLPRFISFSLSLLSFLSLNKLVKNKQSHFPESFISTSCSFLVPQYTWQNSIFW